MEAVEKKPEDERLWLAYWLIFSCVNVLDRLVGMVFSIIPFQNLLRIAFYVWLFYPSTKGALKIYEKGIKVYLKTYETQIESVIAIFKEKISEAAPLVHDVAQTIKKEGTEKVVREATKRTVN
jgi:uncharacterized membrane protein required for colicin V production